MKSFSYLDRKANIDSFQKETFDLVIVGGGINGSGVARDAVSRGMKVALIEADDFASGTSSRSSKLVHGGIRYLENLEFGLVFEALSERAKLFDLAPHLVHPLRFVLPIYDYSRVGMFKMGLGMFLYDVLSMFEAPQLFERLNSKETMGRLPLLEQKGLCGSYVYSDGYMDDDRLVVESLRAANSDGARIANYVKALGGLWEDDKLVGLNCEDVLTNKKFTIKAKHFIGSLGPWTDIFGKQILKNWKPVLRPTKGVHITIAKDRVDLEQAVVMFSEDQKRIIFGIPRHDMIIFGTTDTDFKEDPSDVKTMKEDIDYLLSVVNKYFPGANLEVEDIISSYAGVRPLVDDGSDSEGKTSREHVIFKDQQNITLIAGGKYTTYRLIAEEVVDAALESFTAEERLGFKKSDTLKPLNPKISVETFLYAKNQVGRWHKESGYSTEDLNFLVSRHGLEVEDILNYKQSSNDSIWFLEACHAAENTMCMSLRDFYLRRTPLFLSKPDHGLSLLPEVHKALDPLYSYIESEQKKQEESLYLHINTELNWKKSFAIKNI